MRCHICNTVLSPDEIKFHTLFQEFDPCWTCLAAIDNAIGITSDEEIDQALADDDGKLYEWDISPLDKQLNKGHYISIEDHKD